MCAPRLPAPWKRPDRCPGRIKGSILSRKPVRRKKRTPLTAALPDFWSTAEGLVFQCGDPPFVARRRILINGLVVRLKVILKSLIRSTVRWNRASFSQRFISSVSAPNISGTSVRIVVPPQAIRRSENPPTTGFAVMPDSPSTAAFHTDDQLALPESVPAENVPAYSASSRMICSPSAISSSHSCATRKTDAVSDRSRRCIFQFVDAAVLTAKSSTRTPPAFGWLIRSARIWRV